MVNATKLFTAIVCNSYVLFQVQLVKEYCSAEVRSVVDAYFANPKLMLLPMLA